MSYASSLLYSHMIYWSSCKRNLAVCNELQVSSISSTSVSESREMLYFSSSREWRTSEHILHKVLSKPFTKLMLQTLHNCPFEKIFSISTYVFLSFEWFIAIRLCLTVKKKKKSKYICQCTVIICITGTSIRTVCTTVASVLCVAGKFTEMATLGESHVI